MKKIFCAAVLCLIGLAVNAFGQKQKVKYGKICGNPTVKCGTSGDTFESFEIGFEIPKNYAVAGSEEFYAVILESVRVTSEDCANSFGEDKRLDAQKLFPKNKVFVLRCADFDNIYYTGIDGSFGFMAVYAGKTLTEAKAFLKTIEATGKFKGANVRRLQAQFNGT